MKIKYFLLVAVSLFCLTANAQKIVVAYVGAGSDVMPDYSLMTASGSAGRSGCRPLWPGKAA